MPQPGRPPRFKFSAPLEFQWGSIIIQASVCDISANGMFIETANPLWIGATFSANLMLNPSLKIDCTVSRIDPHRGMAVQVAFACPESNRGFMQLVEKLGRK